jgi:hypothetical protein
MKNMEFQYYWTAAKLWARGDILFSSLIFVLREKPQAVVGRHGTYALIEIVGGIDEQRA